MNLDQTSQAPSAPRITLHHMLARAHLRLILFAILTAGITLTVAGAVAMRGYASRNLDLIAQTVSYTVEPAILFDDAEAAREGMMMVAGSVGVRSVELLDARGHRITAWARRDTRWLARANDMASDILWPEPARATVRHDGRVIGEVRVHGDMGGIGRYILSGLLTSLCCLAITALATYLLARRLRRDVTGPLAQIAEVAHAVRVDRVFDRRVPSSAIAEIDSLADDFNGLLSELQGWHEGITRENRALVRQASHDTLTALGNRAMFEDRLRAAADESALTGQPFAILYIDANRFKQVNDTYGHDAGDVMLVVIAARLRAAVRRGDLAFRLGGDEFALLLSAPAHQEDVDMVIARIQGTMAEPIMLPNGTGLIASLSIGFALSPDHNIDPRDLLRQADAAMYAAKLSQRSTNDDRMNWTDASI
jgi:diguanylate cyclase (GGDEF)-like protein